MSTTKSIAIYYQQDNKEITEEIIPITIIENNTDYVPRKPDQSGTVAYVLGIIQNSKCSNTYSIRNQKVSF